MNRYQPWIYTYISIFLFFINGIHAMETVHVPCYLAQLPIELQNMIAEYLPFKDWETDAECIDRTKKQPEIPKHYRKQLHRFAQWGQGLHPLYTSFSHDCSKLIFLQIAYKGVTPCAHVTIMGTNTNEEVICADKPDLAKLLDEYQGVLAHFAFSKNVKFVAVHEPLPSKKLIVKNVTTQTNQEFPLPDTYLVDSLAFNKQTTKVLVHYKSYSVDKQHNQIKKISQKFVPIVPEQEMGNYQKTLNGYFKQRGVCKDINYSVNT